MLLAERLRAGVGKVALETSYALAQSADLAKAADQTWASQSFGTELTNRMIVVTLCMERHGGTSICAVDKLTIGGTNILTGSDYLETAGVSSSYDGNCIIAWVRATGTSGDIVVSYNQDFRVNGRVYVLQNVFNDDALADRNGTEQDEQETLTVDLDAQNGGMLIAQAGHYRYQSNTSATFTYGSASLTGVIDTNGSNFNAARGYVSVAGTETDRTVTHTWGSTLLASDVSILQGAVFR